MAAWRRRPGKVQMAKQKKSHEGFCGEDEGFGLDLTDDDIFALHHGHAGSALLLDRYSVQDIEDLMGRFGIREKLRRRGHTNVSIELDMSDPFVQKMTWHSAVQPEAEPDLICECVLRVLRGVLLLKAVRPAPEEGPAAQDGARMVQDWADNAESSEKGQGPLKLMVVEWLLLQDPLAPMGSVRLLPGQHLPGLGVVAEFVAMLRHMAEETACDAMVNRPMHFHNAAMYSSSNTTFLNPHTEDCFRALCRDLLQQEQHGRDPRGQEGEGPGLLSRELQGRPPQDLEGQTKCDSLHQRSHEMQLQNGVCEQNGGQDESAGRDGCNVQIGGKVRHDQDQLQALNGGRDVEGHAEHGAPQEHARPEQQCLTQGAMEGNRTEARHLLAEISHAIQCGCLRHSRVAKAVSWMAQEQISPISAQARAFLHGAAYRAACMRRCGISVACHEARARELLHLRWEGMAESASRSSLSSEKQGDRQIIGVEGEHGQITERNGGHPHTAGDFSRVQKLGEREHSIGNEGEEHGGGYYIDWACDASDPQAIEAALLEAVPWFYDLGTGKAAEKPL